MWLVWHKCVWRLVFSGSSLQALDGRVACHASNLAGFPFRTTQPRTTAEDCVYVFDCGHSTLWKNMREVFEVWFFSINALHFSTLYIKFVPIWTRCGLSILCEVVTLYYSSYITRESSVIIEIEARMWSSSNCSHTCIVLSMADGHFGSRLGHNWPQLCRFHRQQAEDYFREMVLIPIS